MRGKDIEVAAVGEEATALLQAIDFEGKPCEVPIKSFKCELASEITGTRASCRVERRGQSQYQISYQPTIKGRHQLHIKVEGQHVRGSPFSVAVKQPVEKLGTPIKTLVGLKKPQEVVVSETGEVLVTEGDRQCVSVFSSSGEKLRSFGTRGSSQGQFDHPSGVAVDGEGNILVVDWGNHCVQKFTVEGQFLTAVGTKGKHFLQFKNPYGIACNAAKVYVVDAGNNRVQVLNSDLTFSSTFGKSGTGKGQFNSPRGIACDSTGKVYVADCGNNCIQVFTAEGKFLRMFGQFGQGRGHLYGPFGVAIDSSDTVHISERHNNRVSVFTSEGQFVTSFKNTPDFHGLHGLTVDKDGVLYVCDCLNDKVNVF